MKLGYFGLILLAFLLFSLRLNAVQGAAATSPPIVTKYDSAFAAFSGDVESQERAGAAILKTSRDETLVMIRAGRVTAAVSKEHRLQVLRAFDSLRRRSDFDRALATEMMAALKPGAPDLSAKSALERRLEIFLLARTGGLTPEKIDSIFSEISSNTSLKTGAAATRLLVLAGLMDAMQTEKLKPTVRQLESLLASSSSTIRRHAVDWFEMAPPESPSDRNRFLKKALVATTDQVREAAYRTIASWNADEIKAVRASGDVLPEKCMDDPVAEIRRACAQIKSKSGTR